MATSDLFAGATASGSAQPVQDQQQKDLAEKFKGAEATGEAIATTGPLTSMVTGVTDKAIQDIQKREELFKGAEATGLAEPITGERTQVLLSYADQLKQQIDQRSQERTQDYMKMMDMITPSSVLEKRREELSQYGTTRDFERGLEEQLRGLEAPETSPLESQMTKMQEEMQKKRAIGRVFDILDPADETFGQMTNEERNDAQAAPILEDKQELPRAELTGVNEENIIEKMVNEARARRKEEMIVDKTPEEIKAALPDFLPEKAKEYIANASQDEKDMWDMYYNQPEAFQQIAQEGTQTDIVNTDLMKAFREESQYTPTLADLKKVTGTSFESSINNIKKSLLTAVLSQSENLDETILDAIVPGGGPVAGMDYGQENGFRETIKKGLKESYKQLAPEEFQAWQGGGKKEVENVIWDTIDEYDKANAEMYESLPENTKNIYKLMMGASSIGTAIGATYLTKNPEIAALFLANMDASDTYIEARKSGLSPDQAQLAYATSVAGSAVLEKIGLDQILKAGPAKNILKNFIKRGITEGGTEVLQTGFQDIVGKIAYDKEWSSASEYWDSFWVGGIMGGVMGGAVDLPSIIKGEANISDKENTAREKFVGEVEKAGIDKAQAEQLADAFKQKTIENANTAINKMHNQFSFKEQRLAGFTGLRSENIRPGIETPAPLPQDDISMLAVHNLTEGNLQFADKIGGLANPSLALFEPGKAEFESFGDITLVAPQSMIDPKAMTKGGTYGADVYSPRFPQTEFIGNRESIVNIERFLEKYNDKVGENAAWIDLNNDVFRNLENSGHMLYSYLESKNIKPEIIKDENGAIDGYRTKNKMREQVQESENAQDFSEYIAKFLEDNGMEQKLWAGRTPSGTPRYKPLNVEEASKIMGKQVRGQENFFYGLGSIRSMLTPKFKSMKQIKGAKEKIVNREKLDVEIKKREGDLEEIVNDLMSLSKSDEFGEYGRTVENVGKYMAGIDVSYFKEKYGELPKKLEAKINKLKEDLIEMPTEYFETKYTRPVGLNEFGFALVPNYVSPKTIKMLEDKGLTVKKYNKEEKGARNKILQEIIEEQKAGKLKLPKTALKTDKFAYMRGSKKGEARVEAAREQKVEPVKPVQNKGESKKFAEKVAKNKTDTKQKRADAKAKQKEIQEKSSIIKNEGNETIIKNFNGKEVQRIKTRSKLAKKMIESPMVDEGLKQLMRDNPSTWHEVITDKEVSDYLDGMTEAELRETISEMGESKPSVWAAQRLVEKLQNEGRFDEALDVYEDAQKMSTKAGQLLQAQKVWSWLTPEGKMLNILKKLEKFDEKSLTKAIKGNFTKDKETGIRTLKKQHYERIHDLFVQEEALNKKISEVEEKGIKTLDPKYINQHKKLKKEHRALSRKIGKEMSSVLPAKISDTLTTIIQGNLLSPLSQIKNPLYNLMFTPATASGKTIGAVMDWIYSKVTGKERVLTAGSPVEYFKGLISGTVEAGDIMMRGALPEDLAKVDNFRAFAPARAFMSAISGKDLPINSKTGKPYIYDRVNKFIEGTLGWAPEVMFRMLAFGDKPFYRATMRSAAAEIANLKGLEGVKRKMFIEMPDAESLEMINKAADAAVFQQDSKIANQINRFFNWVGEQPGIGGLGKFFFRTQGIYVKTPVNVISRTMDFLVPPISIAKAFKSGMLDGDRRSAMIHMGESVVGTMMLSAAYTLVKAGLVNGDEYEDKKTYELERVTQPLRTLNLSGLKRMKLFGGDGDTTFREGDTVIDYDIFGMMGAALDLEFSKKKRKDEAAADDSVETGWMDSAGGFIQDTFGLADYAMNKTFLQGTNQLLDALKEPDGYKFRQWAQNTMGMVTGIAVPNTWSSVLRTKDPYMRDTKSKTLTEAFDIMLKQKIFGTEDLPIKKGLFGEEIKRTPESRNPWVYNMLDPFKFRETSKDPVYGELYNLYLNTEDKDVLPNVPADNFTVDGEKVQLNRKEYSQYLEDVGKFRKEIIDDILDSDYYDKLNNEQKIELLGEAYDEGADMGKNKFLGKPVEQSMIHIEWEIADTTDLSRQEYGSLLNEMGQDINKNGDAQSSDWKSYQKKKYILSGGTEEGMAEIEEVLKAAKDDKELMKKVKEKLIPELKRTGARKADLAYLEAVI